MNDATKLLFQKEWRVLDQTSSGLIVNALQSFGTDDCLCASVGSKMAPATARAWVHQHTIALGIQDTKLPYLEEGLSFLKQKGYQSIVRNSGGLAVVLDDGILNLTLVFPENEKKIDINRGYETMYYMIKEMFADLPMQIDAKEISGSYCPGSYDLSIEGKKFAGISQRRLKNGVAVQIYLCVNGSGGERAELLRNFYCLAKGKTETKFHFPKINKNVMASLSELLKRELTIEEVMLRFLKVLKEKTDSLYTGSLIEAEIPLMESYHHRVIERNRKVFEEIQSEKP